MASPRRPIRFPRVRKVRRAVEWVDSLVNAVLTSGSTISFDLTSGVVQAQRKGMSLVRVISDIEAILSVAGTGGLISYGVALWQAEAVSVLPDPNVSAIETSWIRKVGFRSISSNDPSDRSQYMPMQFDAKTNRRLRNNETEVRYIIKAETLTNNVNLNGIVRCLFMKA